MPLGLLNAEGAGFQCARTLPLRISTIVASKALISTATYVPVPLALLGMAVSKPLTSPVAILIPCITVLAVASASVFEVRLFLGFTSQGRISAVIHDLGRLAMGVSIVLIPEVVYAATYTILVDHVSAILTMFGTALAELAMALYLLRRQ